MAHDERGDPDAQNRGQGLRKIVDAVDERVRGCLVHERVERGESQEREGEGERPALAGPCRDPCEDGCLRGPAGHQCRPVDGECESHSGEPDTHRDEQRGDLGAHPLAEAEAAERHVARP